MFDLGLGGGLGLGLGGGEEVEAAAAAETKGREEEGGSAIQISAQNLTIFSRATRVLQRRL